MLIIDKHCSNICCDEFPVPQIDRKSKQVKEQWHGKFYLQSLWGKLAILNTENIKIFGSVTKLEVTKMQVACIFFHICWISAENLNFSQGSVATCLRWGGYCRISLVANFIRFPAVQRFWNQLRFEKFTDGLKVGTFFETQCSNILATPLLKQWHTNCPAISILACDYYH